MLNASEEKMLKGLLYEMARIQNAIPGEAFSSKDADTLMVLQRRMKECEVKRQLQQFNEIFGRQNGAGIADITNSMIAYVRVKALLTEGVADFDARSYRKLIKECRSQIDRTENIIRLSKANAMTAEDFQKDKIILTIRKNETFLNCFKTEIAAVEKKIERMPMPVNEPEEVTEEESDKEDIKPSENVKKGKAEKSGKNGDLGSTLTERLDKFLHVVADKREVEERLRNEEKRSSHTMCEEIPYYEKKLIFSEYFPCKDLGAYCILKRKDNVYFGLRAHADRGIYENADQSLMELTNVSEEFIQLMTEDVLSGEYKLTALSQSEKKSMQMYLNFITDCFEKNIGVTLSAAEYMAFKNYYSRLVNEVMILEEEAKANYYRAIPLADEYLAFMDAYNMVHSEKKSDVVRTIELGNSADYQENLQLILENHVTDEKAKDKLCDLITKLKYFLEPEIREAEKENGIVIMPKDFEEAKIKIRFQDRNIEVTDEAIFASGNLKQAVSDYMSRPASMKKIGLILNEKEIYLFGAKEGAVSIPLLNDKTKEMRGLNDGVVGQMVSFYEEQMKREMTDYTEGKSDE